MKNLNIQRLLDASPYINLISDGTYNALFDYYEEMEDITNINVDNDIVNGISELTMQKFADSWYDRDDVYILYENSDEDIISFFN